MPDPSVTYAPRNADNYCYRHPDRQSFVLCQRCGRTICPQCQTPGAVGVLCPECMREQRANAPRVKPQVVTRMNSLARSGGPIATYVLMGLLALGFLVGLVPGAPSRLAYIGPYATIEPWRIITGLFVYNGLTSILQLAFNGYMLYFFGGMIERQIGSIRYAALYLVGGLGAEAAVTLVQPGSSVLLGGTAAVFGLFGAFYMIQRHLGNQAVQILVIVALNVVIGLVVGTPWTAYVGAVLIGGLVGWIFMRLQNRSQRPQQIGATVAVAVVLLAIILLRSAQLAGLL
ncbi:rhomboid family intramembrane serine protease [Frondihabitans australicus]|uniref:Membrane associated rhomboid family serine protease n=1 Tax=Frondihabitans australicus TaxID=386892 RepID=A0A495IIK1_9MICO|nr:rhomboid family intramembrane serine protease [Frondihabitans australicus]RKR75817.1 membrane associated rhomboid family serine protease [Frondihabitans australicus]